MEKNPSPEKAAEQGAADTAILWVMHIKDGQPDFLIVEFDKKNDKAGVVAAKAKALAKIPKKNKVRLVCQGVILSETASVLAENEARIVNGKCAWELVEEEPRK